MTDEELRAYLDKGGTIKKVPPSIADVEPIRRGRYHAIKERQDMAFNRQYRGRGLV